MKPTILLVLVVFMAAACSDGSPAPTSAPIPVEGYAHAGPTCPVVQDPPDPACADRPVAGAEILILDATGETVDAVSTAEDGTFSLSLAPGAYRVVPQPVEGLLGTAGAQDIVVDTTTVALDLAYDTGIR